MYSETSGCILAFLSTKSDIEFNEDIRGVELKNGVVRKNETFIAIVTIPQKFFCLIEHQYWIINEYIEVKSVE